MEVINFFDKQTFTLTYLVINQSTSECVIIDPVLNFDYPSSKLSSEGIDEIINYIKENNLILRLVLETHAHADHITSSQYIKRNFPEIKIAISKDITVVQKYFKSVFNLEDLRIDGSDFDILLNDNDIITYAGLDIKSISTPGHTPACMSFLIEDCLFTGDAIFMPDMGTGRCDFPHGSAKALYNSIKERIFNLPDETKIYVGHDYQPNGRELRFQSTVKEQKVNNIQLKENTSEKEYVEFRTSRDATLDNPRLLLPSIQINIRAGKSNIKENNGTSYLKLPIINSNLLS